MITYSKYITAMNVKNEGDLENVIVNVRVEYHAVDDTDGTPSVYQNEFNLTPPDPASFVEYNNITEEQVWNWVFAMVTEEQMQADCNRMIINQRKTNERENSAPRNIPLPWAS